MDPTQTRHLVLVSLLLSCALAAPQFAYTTSTIHNPYVPLPLARAPVYDVYNNQIDRSLEEAAPEPARLPHSPYHYIPATLPLAIYSEPAHILSGYSYQTLDPAGAKSQVLFVSGPNSQQLFRQNADLLNIVLPSLFTAYGNAVIPTALPEWDAANNPQQADTAAANDESAPAPTSESDSATNPEKNPTSEPSTEPASSSESASSEEEAFSTTGESDPKVENASPEPKTEDDTSLEESKPIVTSPVTEDDTSKEESDKSSEVSEVEGSTSNPAMKVDNDDVKINDDVKNDVSTSEASNSVKTVPLEGDSRENASTEIPSTAEKTDASENTSENVNSGEEKGSDSKDGQTTTSTEAATTTAPAE